MVDLLERVRLRAEVERLLVEQVELVRQRDQAAGDFAKEATKCLDLQRALDHLMRVLFWHLEYGDGDEANPVPEWCDCAWICGGRADAADILRAVEYLEKEQAAEAGKGK